ncbi:hypothetical protein MKX01_005635 [Papaver californicum]|nr:hypothetical protein MKX01_005635 [Papaver californicum]
MDGRFCELLEEASMPVLEVLTITVLGAFMATKYCNLLSADARKHMNKIVFVVFSPALVFASFSKTVVVKLLKPEPHVAGLVIACCSADEYKAFQASKETLAIQNKPNQDLDATQESHLLKSADKQDQDQEAIRFQSTKSIDDDEYTKNQAIVRNKSNTGEIRNITFLAKLKGFLHLIVEELLTPPTIAAVLGLIFGAVTWLKNLIIGDDAPLRVIQDSVTLLGNGAIPCITLILGGNLTQASGCYRDHLCKIHDTSYYRIGVVKAAETLGLLPTENLFQYVLMIQFSLPPAMNLFDVGQDECSIILLWTYLVAALALTIWSAVFIYVLA